MNGHELPPGKTLGPYEIVELIGTGGMGEVYRGRDTRLGRDVAVKVLAPSSSADPQAVQRFRQEAQAASALNHQNIVTVYDVGIADETPFIVTELLEGETVRQALERNHLTTPDQALTYAAQASVGLAAAHSKGILHRDIKPENLFITRNGTVKILDFGLSKLTSGAVPVDSATTFSTAPGRLLGTTGYVSPEQIRQQTVDHRTDIFSLGVVLYETLAGRPPFHRNSPTETLSAILTEDPPQLSGVRPGLTAAIDEVLRACLDKDPERRFESAADLALTLRAMRPVADKSTGQWWRKVRPGRRASIAIAIGFLLLAGFGVPIAVGRFQSTPLPTYRRITFVRGNITSGRFRPGSGEIIYDGTINGEPRELLATIPGSAEARTVGVPGAELLGISRSGEMALSLNPRLVRGFVHTGTLAFATEGLRPRETLTNVHAADWAPDGKTLAIVREVGGRTRLEHPINTVKFETSGWISDVRFSPDGNRIAFVDHPVNADDLGRVMVIEPDGSHRILSGDWVSILGVAWSASGEEVWFTAQDRDATRALRGVDLQGRLRVVAHVPARIRLLDISPDGRVLLAQDDVRLEAHAFRAGGDDDRNVSWLDWSLARDISADGKSLLITEFGEAAGELPGIYMRPMDGSRAARLGTGSGLALSPDGRRVLSIWKRRLSLLPVGTGEITTLPNDTIATYDPWAGFSPDARHIVFTGVEPGRGPRVYLQEIPNGRPVPITSEGFRVASPASVSPNGEMVAVIGHDEGLFLCSISGAMPQRVAGAARGEAFARWERDGRAMFVFDPAQIPVRVYRLGLDGRREVVKTLRPADLAGAIAIHRLVMTAGGDAFAFTLERQLSDLYVAAGFEDPPAALDLMRRLKKMLTLGN